jgi:RES domain-containing protein
VGDLTVWRLTKAKHASSALSGYGSTLRAGRWHPRGRSVVYCAASPSLALIETLVHAERADLLRFEYVAIPVTFGVDLLERMEAEDLPPDWRAWPHPASTQAIGVRWFDALRSVVLECRARWCPTSATTSSTRCIRGFVRFKRAFQSLSPWILGSGGSEFMSGGRG